MPYTFWLFNPDRYSRALAAAFEDGSRRLAAARRAEGLLRALLTPAQRVTYDMFGYIEVVGSASTRTYRLYRGATGNVFALTHFGTERAQYCGHPEYVPDEDVMITQKLLIETDELAFLRAANRLR